MENSAQIKEYIQKALHIICTAKHYEEEACLIAQRLGLQGEKRRLACESVMNHILANKIRRCAYDVYGFIYSGKYPEISIPEMGNYKMFFETYLAKMEEQHDALHNIANMLVTLNSRYFAMHLYDKCECIIKDIEYYRRTITEGNAAEWKPEWIFLHQTTAQNIHDHFEELEKKFS